jgi:hypothetical protein
MPIEVRIDVALQNITATLERIEVALVAAGPEPHHLGPVGGPAGAAAAACLEAGAPSCRAMGGLMSHEADEPMPAWAMAMRADIMGKLAEIHDTLTQRIVAAIAASEHELLDRMNKLEARVDEQASRILGAVRLAAAADQTAAGADTASLERDLARSRAQAALSGAVGTLLQQVAAIEDQLRALREGGHDA